MKKTDLLYQRRFINMKHNSESTERVSSSTKTMDLRFKKTIVTNKLGKQVIQNLLEQKEITYDGYEDWVPIEMVGLDAK
jgi:hypothetical protein